MTCHYNLIILISTYFDVFINPLHKRSLSPSLYIYIKKG